MNAVATVTSRGQVTLPKCVRQVLQSRLIEFELREQMVVVRPVKSVAGALAAYATSSPPLSEIRDDVWKEVARGKARKRTS